MLLKGVNDNAEELCALARVRRKRASSPITCTIPTLRRNRAFPLADRRGQRIFAELNRRLSGPARPVYVLDIPGGYGKISLAEQAAQETRPAGGG